MSTICQEITIHVPFGIYIIIRNICVLEETKHRSEVAQLGHGRTVTERGRDRVVLVPSFAVPGVQYYELTKLLPRKQMEVESFQCHSEVKLILVFI